MSGEPSHQPRVFIDSNIWLYAFVETQDVRKTATAKRIVAIESAVLSVQVVNEVCYNLLRKAAFSETQVQSLIDSFYTKYEVVSLDQTVLRRASIVRRKFGVAFWDGLIAAAALTAGVSVLYSEDMHDGLIIEGMRIENPFTNAPAQQI